MQFSDEDKKRYTKLAGQVSERGRQSLADLSRYAKHEIVMHCPGSGFRVENTKNGTVYSLAGAHRVLQACLWSSNSVSSSRKKCRKRKRDDGACVFNNGKSYFGSARGLARGKDVHEEIAHFVMLPPAQFRARYSLVDPMTKAVLLHLKKLAYTAVHAEYMVYNKSLNAGTAVDLVCLDRAGHLVFVELKTGYRDVFTKHRSQMQPPFGQLADSPLNRARTQLLYAIVLYKSNHRTVPEGRVVHVDAEYQAVSFPMGEVTTDAASLASLTALISAGRHKTPKEGPRRRF